MSNALDTKVARAKLETLLSRLKPRSEEHVHIDAFFEHMPPPDERIAITKELFALGCDVVKHKRDEILCFATIGLRPDEHLHVAPPSEAALIAELADEESEPPAVHFVPRDVGQVLMRQEEYRRPCALSGFMGRDDWYPEYRTYRSDPNDLFWRGIWVQDLPEQFRV